jgi:hypothetical protein
LIAILARAHDETARSLVERWREHQAALLSPRDLSRRGWRYRPEAPGDGQAVVAGNVVAVTDLCAVVTLLGDVRWHDLPHIVPADREYVASEMRAFLLAWLETLPCRMLNRPTPASLTGCGWSAERWRLAAAALGIPTMPMPGVPSDRPVEDQAVAVTYIGGETLNAPSSRVSAWVRQLASVAQTGTLVARFCDGLRPRLAAVTVVPDLARAEVADAALRWLHPVAA